MAEGDTLLNAAIGAAVSILLSWLPAAAVLGGALAGYLQVREADLGEGARVGAISGLIALVPVLLFMFLFAAFIPFVPAEIGALGLLFGLVVVVGAAIYFVGAGALGGVLGAYLKEEL